MRKAPKVVQYSSRNRKIPKLRGTQKPPLFSSAEQKFHARGIPKNVHFSFREEKYFKRKRLMQKEQSIFLWRGKIFYKKGTIKSLFNSKRTQNNFIMEINLKGHITLLECTTLSVCCTAYTIPSTALTSAPNSVHLKKYISQADLVLLTVLEYTN